MRNLIYLLTFFLSQNWVSAQHVKDPVGEKRRMEFDKAYFAGMKEKMVNNFTDAENEFRNALRIDPKNAAAQYQLATVLLSRGQASEAVLHSEKAFLAESSNEWYARLLIELYKNEKRYADAIPIAERIYKEGKDAHFLYELSGLYLLTKKYKKAIQVLDRVEQIQGVTEQTSRQKEEIYLQKGDLKGAIRELEKLSRTFPDQVLYRGMLADLYMQGKREREGEAIYLDILRKDPISGQAAFSLAAYYHGKGKLDTYLEYLLKGMRSSLDANTKTQVLATFIPSQQLGTKHVDAIRQLVDAFLETHRDEPQPYMFLGDRELQDRNLEKAREYYLRAIEKDSSFTVAWDQILICDQGMERYDLLRDDCSLIIARYPEYAQAYLFKSIACRQLKQYELALEVARAGLIHATDENLLLSMLTNLGDIAWYAGAHEVSDSAYEAVLGIEPNHALALNNFAYFLSLRNKDLDRAESMSKRSIELDPNNSSNLDTYGWILFLKKDYTGARNYIERSLAITPENAEVLEHLGDVLYRLNLPEEALRNWEKAKRLGAQSEALELKIRLKKLP